MLFDDWRPGSRWRRASALRAGRAGSFVGSPQAMVCGIAYWNSFEADLILDDIPTILQGPRLRLACWQNLRANLMLHWSNAILAFMLARSVSAGAWAARVDRARHFTF